MYYNHFQSEKYIFFFLILFNNTKSRVHIELFYNLHFVIYNLKWKLKMILFVTSVGVRLNARLNPKVNIA